jgi:hypothetical protein
MVRLGPGTAEELGFCDEVDVKEIGGRKVVIVAQKEDAKDGVQDHHHALEGEYRKRLLLTLERMFLSLDGQSRRWLCTSSNVTA